ncbi:hypothetical protein ACFL5Z_11590, partial [Planctomycetota bacterium]
MRKGVLCVVIYSVLTTAPFSYSNTVQDSYEDVPFVQDFAEKIPLSGELSGTQLSVVRSDRNGRILVLSDKGLLHVHNGTLVPDRHYRPLLDMQIRSMDTYRDQFVYLTDKVVFSNAWAGQFDVPHKIPDAGLLKVGSRFDVLLAGNNTLAYFNQGKCVDQWKTPQSQIKQILFDQARNRFLILSGHQVDCYTPGKGTTTVFKGNNLNCLELIHNNKVLVIGTPDGYIELDAASFRQRSALKSKLPCTDIRCVRQIDDVLWFGTSNGAFALRGDGRIDYYTSKRWLVDDNVIDISEGPNDSVLILTHKGLNIIHFEMMTLQQKADHFDKLTRRRHMRHGLNCALAMSKAGDLSTGTLMDSDNDGLWTAMYLAGELFRYAATKSDDVLQNCYESFEAMERLYSINPLEGFPSRSFERAGYHVSDKSRWQPAEDHNWFW